MTRTTNIATNPIRSLRTAFFTMVACAMALVGPQTYASSCAAEDAAFHTAYAAYVEAEDTLADAAANLAAAEASGNIIWRFAAHFYMIFSQAAYNAAMTNVLAAVDAYVDCLDAAGEND